MPHGGYHGTVKVGGRTVQQASRSDGRGGQTGGGRYRAEGYNKPKSSNQTAAELTKQIRDQMAADPDPRSAYIGAQADASRLSNLLRQEQEQNLANSIAASFAKGTARKSDFTGNAGDKTFLGLNYGSTPTAAATVINPITGEKIITNKVREGMTSPEYANYMRGLYSLNPTLMEETFPFASGKTIRNLSRFAPGLGTFQSIAGFVGGKTGDAIQGLKQIAINKGILPPTTLNPNTGTTIDPTKVQNVSELDPGTKALIAPDVYGGRSPIDEAFASLPSTQFGREYMQRFGPRQDFRQPNTAGMLQTDPNMFTNPATGRPLVFAPIPSEVNQLRGNIPGIGSTTKMTRNMFEQLDPFTNPDVPFVPMNEGGLASINNPEYTMLRRASDFDI